MRLSYSSRSWRVVARDSGRLIEEMEFWRRHSFCRGISFVGWLVGWLGWTDDEFGEAFEAEGRDGRDSTVLEIDLLQLVSTEG